MYKYILYTGIGSNDSGLHSKEEFLDIMKNAQNHYCEMTFLGFDMEYKDYLLPADFKKFSLDEWLDYTGARHYHL